jgi:hypothetical protein
MSESARSRLAGFRFSPAPGRSVEGSRCSVAVLRTHRVPTLSGAGAGSVAGVGWVQMMMRDVLAPEAQKHGPGNSLDVWSRPASSGILRPFLALLATWRQALRLARPVVAGAQSQAALSWLAWDREALELVTAASPGLASAGYAVEERMREKTGAGQA